MKIMTRKQFDKKTVNFSKIDREDFADENFVMPDFDEMTEDQIQVLIELGFSKKIIMEQRKNDTSSTIS